MDNANQKGVRLRYWNIVKASNNIISSTPMLEISSVYKC
jgi:hypothetical protein